MALSWRLLLWWTSGHLLPGILHGAGGSPDGAHAVGAHDLPAPGEDNLIIFGPQAGDDLVGIGEDLPSYGDPSNPLLVTTHTGQVSGEGGRTGAGQEYRVFRGIPYAEPPVGALRLREPVAKAPWPGVLGGGGHPPCLQPDLQGGVLGSEDCLTLTIYSPHEAADPPLPVMVWLPGGGFVVGGASEQDWNPEFFLDKEVVFAVVQYRLGSLGFLALPGSPHLSGNFGLKDQLEALRWLQVSVAEFGGDPRRVTIFGSGSGAVSVHAHLLSPQGEGLYQAAISQSGNLLTLYEMMFNNLVEKSGQALVDRLDCAGPDPLPCLQAMDAALVLDPAQGVQDILVPDGRFFISAPNIDTDSDNPFLPYDPLYQTVTGLFKKVPYMSGINSDEGGVSLLSDLIHLYKEETTENSLYLMFFLDRETQYEDLKQVERAMKRYYLGTGPYTEASQQGLIDMLTDAKLASPLHQTVIGHLYAGAAAYPYVLTQRCNNVSFSQVFGGEDFGVTAADELPCFFK